MYIYISCSKSFLFNLKFAVFFHEHVFIKDPGTTRGTPWHQDQPYYPVNGRKVILESIILFFSTPLPTNNPTKSMEILRGRESCLENNLK